MSARFHLERLHRRGARFRADGDMIRWIAPAGVVTDADLVALRRLKAEVLAILREEMRDRIEERAEILQFDAGLSHRLAEKRASADADGGRAA